MDTIGLTAEEARRDTDKKLQDMQHKEWIEIIQRIRGLYTLILIDNVSNELLPETIKRLEKNGFIIEKDMIDWTAT